jgi:hypothetical protein
MSRIAHGRCGSLRAEATAPALVGACHCMEANAVLARPLASAPISERAGAHRGTNKVYVRGSDLGRKIELHFYPDCGSTVFRYAEFWSITLDVNPS